MSTLGFPTNPTNGQQYTLNGVTYTWNGVAWLKTNQGNINAGTITGTNIVVTGNTATVGGATVITTATIYQYITQSTSTLINIVAGTDTAVSLIGNTAIIWNTSTLETITSRGNSTDQAIHITNPTNATSTNTGALTITGGVGIGKDLWIGGNIYTNGHYVLTTSSFYNIIDSGPDILITATNAGIVIISDVSTLETVTTRGAISNQVITLTNTSESTSTDTGALLVRHGIGVGGNISVGGQINLAGAEISSSQTVINTTATTLVDTYSSTQYRSSKYLLQVEVGAGYNAAFQVQEIILLVDNLGNVYATPYGVVTSSGELGDFAAEVVGGMVELYFTPSTSTTPVTIKLMRTTLLW